MTPELAGTRELRKHLTKLSYRPFIGKIWSECISIGQPYLFIQALNMMSATVSAFMSGIAYNSVNFVAILNMQMSKSPIISGYEERRNPTIKKRHLLKSYVVGTPFERIATDIAGPFPTTKTGNFLLAWAGQFSGIKNQTMHRFEQYLKILQLYHENSRFPPSFKFEA
jgi:hypothetical protein